MVKGASSTNNDSDSKLTNSLPHIPMLNTAYSTLYLLHIVPHPVIDHTAQRLNRIRVPPSFDGEIDVLVDVHVSHDGDFVMWDYCASSLRLCYDPATMMTTMMKIAGLCWC